VAPGQPMPPKARLLGSRQSQGTIQRLRSGHDRATSSSPVVAQAEIAPSIARAKSESKRFRLESEWAVENSRGERLLRSQARIPMEKSRPSLSTIFRESWFAHELLDGLEALLAFLIPLIDDCLSDILAAARTAVQPLRDN